MVRGCCRLWCGVMVGAAALSALASGWWLWRPREQAAPPTVDLFALPALSTSPYLNTGSDAHYIGVAACAECHPGQYRSYLRTDHSRALGDVDPADEPPDQAFFHEASGRHYRSYRSGNQLRHEEVFRDADGTIVARADWPLRYRVGSGRFSRTYL
ncbi:MAG: cytochrome c family protein, partial [Gemmataceae bacterium]|nr:cytochrome c family protein [Gemmataceae bacterium]